MPFPLKILAKRNFQAIFFSLTLVSAMSSSARSADDIDVVATDQVSVAAQAKPYRAAEMLDKLRVALEENTLLNEDFYDDGSLSKFFGSPYIFKVLQVPPVLNVRVTSIDSVELDESDPQQGAEQQIALHPVLKNGKIYLSQGAVGQLLSHFVLNTNAPNDNDDSMNTDLVERVFGKPTSIVEATPEESTDLSTARVDHETQPLGNSLLSYQSVSDGIFKTLVFKTNPAGEVAQIQVHTGKK